MTSDAPPADPYDWGPDPPPFTPEEIEDLRRNGRDLSEVIASILAVLNAEPGPGGEAVVVP